MRFKQAVLRHVVSFGIALGIAVLAVVPRTLGAADTPAADVSESNEKSANGAFVSFRDGTLTIKGKSGSVVYKQVGKNYKAYENNEAGPGSKLVDTVEALSRVEPGTVVRVLVEKRIIYFGLDHRVIGAFESYTDGKLTLIAANAPPGFIKIPEGKVTIAVDPATPTIQSINGAHFHYAGPAGEVLKTIKAGTVITARSESDVDTVEVVQIGESKSRIERYAGQTRATIRGSFISYKDGILRLRAKGLRSRAINEYERLFNMRINDSIPIFESIDGGAYQPVNADTLKNLKEGMIVTVRKVEEVIIDIQIGVAK